VLKANLGISKIRVFLSGTWSQTLDLEKNFAKCCQLSSTKMDAQCDILAAAVGRTKLTIPATVDVNGCVTLSAHIRVHHYALMHSPRCYGSINYYSASGREAECCEEHVCLSVCLSVRPRAYPRKYMSNLCTLRYVM